MLKAVILLLLGSVGKYPAFSLDIEYSCQLSIINYQLLMVMIDHNQMRFLDGMDLIIQIQVQSR
jgi:hypothetical protein